MHLRKVLIILLWADNFKIKRMLILLYQLGLRHNQLYSMCQTQYINWMKTRSESKNHTFYVPFEKYRILDPTVPLVLIHTIVRNS